MAGIPEIRAEIEDDIAGIRQLTQLAFRDRPYAGGDEQDVIDRLRVAGALTLSLVAVIDGELVGQVTFSPAYMARRQLGSSRFTGRFMARFMLHS